LGEFGLQNSPNGTLSDVHSAQCRIKENLKCKQQELWFKASIAEPEGPFS
jgi:hypothetical protein